MALSIHTDEVTERVKDGWKIKMERSESGKIVYFSMIAVRMYGISKVI